MIKPEFWKQTPYQIKAYTDEQKQALEKFCQQASQERQKPASANMRIQNLLHLIEVEDRFFNGEFLLFYVNNEVVAVSGYHPFEQDVDSFVCGVRTYTLSQFEHFGIHSNFLLPFQLKKVLQAPERQSLLVFNEYNKKIFHFVDCLTTLLNKNLGYELKAQPLPKRITYKNTAQFGVLIYHQNIRMEVFESMYL